VTTNDRQNRQPLDFQEIKVLSDQPTRLAVRIVRATGDTGRQMYRYGIGTLGRVGTDSENKFFREVSIFVDVHDRHATVRKLDVQVLGRLVAEAEEFIRTEMQSKLDEQDWSQSSRGPSGPPGLKTLSRRDAQKREKRGEQRDGD
jgi:hypothetical protein